MIIDISYILRSNLTSSGTNLLLIPTIFCFFRKKQRRLYFMAFSPLKGNFKLLLLAAKGWDESTFVDGAFGVHLSSDKTCWILLCCVVDYIGFPLLGLKRCNNIFLASKDARKTSDLLQFSYWLTQSFFEALRLGTEPTHISMGNEHITIRPSSHKTSGSCFRHPKDAKKTIY